MENDLQKREVLKENFDLVNEDNYKKVYIGQDWYIALKCDNTLERVVLPTKDDRKQEEMNFIMNHTLCEVENDALLESRMVMSNRK